MSTVEGFCKKQAFRKDRGQGRLGDRRGEVSLDCGSSNSLDGQRV